MNYFMVWWTYERPEVVFPKKNILRSLTIMVYQYPEVETDPGFLNLHSVVLQLP